MSQATSEELQDTLSAAVEMLNLDGELSFKAMFGGVLGYMEGRAFASLSDVGPALKLSPADQDVLLRTPGAARLRYAPDAPESKQYIVVPQAVWADAEALGGWVARSRDFVRTLPASKAKPGKSAQRPGPGLGENDG